MTTVSCLLYIREPDGCVTHNDAELDPSVPILVGDVIECACGTLRVIGRRLTLSGPCWPETIAVSHVLITCERLKTGSGVT
jgi:hypothetical protein